MPIVMLVDNPNGSEEIYEKARVRLGLERPAGGVLHVAGPSPKGGWRVIEVFDSEEEAKRFLTERLGPTFRAIGASPAPSPEFWPVHTYMAEGSSAPSASEG
jgi:hypothetical protein